MGAPGSGRRLKAGPMAPEPGTELWDRQPVDTELSFAAFTVYRDFGATRTLARLAEHLGKPARYQAVVEGWSREHRWRQRCAAWDAHQDKVKTEAILQAKRDAAKDMVQRHLLLSEHMQSLASVELMRLINLLQAGEEKPDLHRKPRLKPKQIMGLLEYAIKLERLNRDEPESITETRDKKIPTEELEERIKHLLGARDEW
jgi:hypothetical protein